MNSIEVDITKDEATPAVASMERALVMARVQRVVGTACTLLTKEHLNALPPNKMGWPSQGFYKGAARGTVWDRTPDGVVIKVDNEEHPGAMKQRFHGGTIMAKDHLLTIPARAEFYGHRATEFTNLRLVVFRSGAMALVIGKGGTDMYSHSRNRESGVSGAGARSEAMVAYWLKESVTQKPDPDVMPTPEEYVATAKESVLRSLPPRNGSNN